MQGGSRELDDLIISGGRYYVDGILCDATRPEPGVPVPADGPPKRAARTAPGDDTTSPPPRPPPGRTGTSPTASGTRSAPATGCPPGSRTWPT